MADSGCWYANGIRARHVQDDGRYRRYHNSISKFIVTSLLRIVPIALEVSIRRVKALRLLGFTNAFTLNRPPITRPGGQDDLKAIQTWTPYLALLL